MDGNREIRLLRIGSIDQHRCTDVDEKEVGELRGVFTYMLQMKVAATTPT